MWDLSLTLLFLGSGTVDKLFLFSRRPWVYLRRVWLCSCVCVRACTCLCVCVCVLEKVISPNLSVRSSRLRIQLVINSSRMLRIVRLHNISN